jgi:uncharacterized protein (TIRG00374 family)
MNRNKWLAAGIGIMISLVFLWIAFQNLSPGEVWHNMRQANPYWLLIATVVFFVSVVVIAWRWQFLLRSVKRIPLRELNSLVLIGYAGNNIYPFRSGEILRILLVQRRHRIAIAHTTMTVVIERVFDGLVMLTFIIVPLLFLDIVSPELQRMAAVGAPLFVAALLVFFVLAARPGLLRALVRLISRPLPDRLSNRLRGIGEDIITGLAGLRTPADLAGTIICSYLTWAIGAVVYMQVGYALGHDFSYPLMLLVIGVVNLAGLIPASPGMLGVFEASVRLVLVAAGVPEIDAVTYALVVHAVIWLPATLAGLYLLLRQGLSVGAITRARQLESKAIG